MFVQFFRGRVRDSAGIRRSVERWAGELGPGAVGFVGSTVGITAGGDLVGVARFESAAAAAAAATRPEQGAWWTTTVGCLDGEPEVRDSENVDLLLDDGCDRAQLVQVLTGRGEEAALRDLDRRFVAPFREHRPDFLGAYRAYFPDGVFVDVGYFTSEAEARAAEARVMPEELTGLFAELRDLVSDVVSYDLVDPWLT